MTTATEDSVVWAVEYKIDLEKTPPCEIRLAPTWTDLCGLPSVARIKHMCPDCGRESKMFICQECIDDLRNYEVACRRCENINLRWELI